MNALARFTAIFSVLPTLLVTVATTTVAQSSKVELLKTSPDTVLNVERQAGNCPESVGLWTAFRYYEGGGENTVIADTLAIAGRAKLVSYGRKFVEYTAPLKPAYASCVGKAKDENLNYTFRFRNGNVLFRVELPPDTPANPSGFTARAILGSRPYVRWAIAD